MYASRRSDKMGKISMKLPVYYRFVHQKKVAASSEEEQNEVPSHP